MFISKFLHLKQIQTLANLTLNLPEMINTLTSPIIQQTGNDNTQAHQVCIIILI